jgi:hypothetical protein
MPQSSHITLTREEFLLFKTALYLERAHGSYWRWRYSELRCKYDPNQPRLPAGLPGGGQWTNGEEAGGGSPRESRPPSTWIGKRGPCDVCKVSAASS